MAKEIKIEEATVNILLEIDGIIHIAAMDREKLEAITFLVKRSTETVVCTGKSQPQLNAFLGVGGL